MSSCTRGTPHAPLGQPSRGRVADQKDADRNESKEGPWYSDASTAAVRDKLELFNNARLSGIAAEDEPESHGPSLFSLRSSAYCFAINVLEVVYCDTTAVPCLQSAGTTQCTQGAKDRLASVAPVFGHMVRFTQCTQGAKDSDARRLA